MVFLGLRMWRIEERMNFSMDQGKEMLVAWEMWQNKKVTLIGPEASMTYEGRHFFHGPITYYWLVALGVLGGWDPIRVTWLITLMSLVSMGCLYLAVKKRWGGQTAWLTVVLWTLLPKAIDFAGLIWNPSLLLILVPISWWFFEIALEKRRWWMWLVVGVGLGWMVQSHFQAGLLVILVGVILFFKKIRLDEWLGFVLGLIGGYLPLIVFDIRNDFYNVKTLWGWLGSKKENGVEVQQFYFLWFLPLGIATAASWLKNKKWLMMVVVVTLLIWSVYEVGFVKQAKGMPLSWNYNDLRRVEKIILDNAGEEYNVINLLSGDTRFYPMRFLLIRDGAKILPEDNYENIGEAWVITSYELKTKQNLPWEVEVNKDKKVVGKWEINEEVELVKLK